MESNLPEWAVGSIIIAFIGFGIGAMRMLNLILGISTETRDMHLDPDRYKFGTEGSNKRLDKISRAINDQTYYMKILAEKMVGQKILPPIHDVEEE